MFSNKLLSELLSNGRLGKDISDDLLYDALKQKQEGKNPNSLFDVIAKGLGEVVMALNEETENTKNETASTTKQTAPQHTECGFGEQEYEQEYEQECGCNCSCSWDLADNDCDEDYPLSSFLGSEALADFVGEDSDVVFTFEQEYENEELVMNFDKLTVEDLKFMLETLPLSHTEVIDSQLLAYMSASQEDMENKNQAELAKLRNKMLTVYTSNLLDVNEPLYLNVGKMTVTDFLTSILVVPPNMCDELAEQLLEYLGETAFALTLTTELLDLAQIQEILDFDGNGDDDEVEDAEAEIEVDTEELAKEEKLAKENLAKAIKLYISLYK